jgi:hypothetical protein
MMNPLLILLPVQLGCEAFKNDGKEEEMMRSPSSRVPLRYMTSTACEPHTNPPFSADQPNHDTFSTTVSPAHRVVKELSLMTTRRTTVEDDE